ncbi:unnamed protein product [Euphydryas editha]|uniref:Uncharacterized protein n=1 Tax=Euphydryas editha TaxID=104508 RepID=A0AAU9UQV0_EUPED|nr:unnamed protein product [Euphydryas editha]
MQCPTGEISSFFYKSKLNCLNFTIVEMLEKPETVYKKKESVSGAYVRIKTNLSWFSILMRLGTHFKKIYFITHKYLIKGHTQNEGDNVHSLIEKEIKRKKRSGPISAPYQYVTLIKNARKNGKPFIVKKLTYDFFVDLKLLQEKWGYNFSEDEDKNSVILNNIKVLKFMKTDSFSFYYKISYSQSEFKRVNIRNKRKKMMSPEEIVLTKAFSQRLELSEHKKKDLRNLINKNLIPSYYRDFYASTL